MGNYIRKIAYIHQYNEGGEGKSVGFVRLDIREGIWKLSAQMKGNYGNQGRICQVYGYVKKKEGVSAFLMDEINISGTLAEYKKILQKEGDKDFHGLEGLIFQSDGELYAAFWEEKTGYRRAELMTLMKGEKPLIPEIKAASEEEVIEKKEEKSKEVQIVEIPSAKKEERHFSPVWEKIKNRFPLIHPFEEEKNMEYVHITPKDLQILRKDYWILNNNSFLLHGFYNYKYLILGKKKEEEAYWLGIPGIYHEREQMMADLFGFENFQSASLGPREQGSFGYYVKRVKV